MEDIVALRVTLANGEKPYFLTWGRIPDSVDGNAIEQLLRQALPRFSLGGEPTSVELCPSLREAARAEYFFESFFSMCQETIPYGEGYGTWASDKLELMRQGKQFWFLGAE